MTSAATTRPSSKQVIVRPNKQVEQIKKMGLVEYNQLHSRTNTLKDCERLATTSSLAGSVKNGPTMDAAKKRTMSRLSSTSTPRGGFGSSAPRFRPMNKDPVPKFFEVKSKIISSKQPSTIKVNLSPKRTMLVRPEFQNLQAENEQLKKDLQSFGQVSEHCRNVLQEAQIENQRLVEENERMKKKLDELLCLSNRTVIRNLDAGTQTVQLQIDVNIQT